MQIKSKSVVQIIEEDKNLHEGLVLALKKESMDVLSAYDDEAGLKIALQEKPDLILLDIFSANIRGERFLFSLRKDSYGREIPVLVLTNSLAVEHIRVAMESEVLQYFIKSDWTIPALVQRIKEFLGDD